MLPFSCVFWISFLFSGGLSRAVSWIPESPFSDKAAGAASAPFLKSGPGARAQALSGSYAAAASDSEAIFWNPAGLAHLKGRSKDANFSYNALLSGAYASSLAYAQPIGAFVLGTGLQHFSAGSIRGYDALGDPTSSFSPTDLAFLAGLAGRLSRFHWGGGLKLIRSTVADASGAALAADLGIQTRQETGTRRGSDGLDLGVYEGAVDLGLSVRNLGAPMRISGAADPLPLYVQAGLLWHVGPRVRALIDGHFPVDRDPYASVGLEGNMVFGDGFSAGLRGGYNTGDGRGIEGLAGLTAGFGLDFKRVRLDYAWVPYGDLGDTSRVSLGVRF